MDIEIIIMPGGELVRTYWEYDEVSKKVELKTSNVTDKAPSLMFKSVSLDKNLKLKDILLLFKKNLPFYSIFLNNWVEEFVNEGLDNEPTETFDDVEYLELYWNTNKNTDEDTGRTHLDGHLFPDFHMISKKLSEDKYDEFGTLMYQANQRINYSLSFIPVNNLANIPIKLERKFIICDNDDTSKESIQFDDCEYSLGQVLHGIIWELSFYGPPKDRDKESDIINKAVKDLKEEAKDFKKNAGDKENEKA